MDIVTKRLSPVSWQSLLGCLLIVLAVQWGCVPPQEQVYTDVGTISWQDSTFRRLSDFQDRKMSDSLFAYLSHPNPNFRYLAARAFGTLIDSSAIDSLAPLLADRFDIVRAAAAYAIGQQGLPAGGTLLAGAFEQNDTGGVYTQAHREILSAVGKVGSDTLLEHLASIVTYRPTDTALLEGQAWGLYYFGLRDLVHPKGTERMIDFVLGPEYPEQARLIAGHYLARIDVTIDTNFVPDLANRMTNERDPLIRMTLAGALGKANSNNALRALLRQLDRENDWRVRTNIIRALGGYPYQAGRDRILEAVRDPHELVALTAADYLIDQGTPEDASLYWRFTRDSLPNMVRLSLFRAANRHLPNYFVELRELINGQLRQRFRSASSPYERAAVLRAMGEFPWNFRYIQSRGYQDSAALVRTAAVAALGQVANYPGFTRVFSGASRRTTRELAIYFQQAIQTLEPGMVYEAAQALQNEDRNFAAAFDSLQFISDALEALQLPRDVEAYVALQQARAYLTDSDSDEAVQPEWNHPIDWTVLQSFRKRPEAIIETNKGTIRVELLPGTAPGTVINFVQLAQSGYFNDKVFHRVVPNFVAQGGGPIGDGFGSADYTIRTEVPIFHWNRAGIIGMASAGPDTESVQFFLTHSPTPHLDGRYTAFGTVTQGQQVLDQIRIGDQIERVRIE